MTGKPRWLRFTLATLYATHPVLAGRPAFHDSQSRLPGYFLPTGCLGSIWVGSTSQSIAWNTGGRISCPEGSDQRCAGDHNGQPAYAAEIQTPELGFGFDGILRERRADLTGILNGIDTEQWDPSGDPFLPMPYDAAILPEKATAKATFSRGSTCPSARPVRASV